MPLRVRFVRRGPRRTIDARDLVEAAGDVAVEAIKGALRDGVSPVDGAPRPRNAEGRPVGVRSGRLLNGIRRTSADGNEQRATVTIKPPDDRADWVAQRGDVLVAEGSVAEAIQDAADTFAKGLS